MSDIFLSYANEDRERVRPLADVLNAAGWSVFWDRKIPVGKNWNELLEEEIASARSLVIAWSNNSIRSKWVKEEANEGLRRNLPIFPILLDAILPPLGFRDIQAADLSQWDGTPTSPIFQSLVSDITSVLGQPASVKSKAHDIPGTKAARTPSAEPPLPESTPLEDKTGRLWIETNAPEAKITLLNSSFQFSQGIELEPGRYEIEVKADLFEPRREWIEIISGEDRHLRIQLTQHLAEVIKEKVTGERSETDISKVSLKSRYWYLGAGLGLALLFFAGWWLFLKPIPSDKQKIVHEDQSKVAGLSDSSTRISPAKPKVPAAESVQVLLPSGPPSSYYVINSIGRQPDASLRLTKISEKQNKITDTDEWWIGNQLPPLTFAIEDLPAAVPKEFRGNRVVKVIRSQPILAIYGTDFSDGRYVLGISPQSGQIEFAFDFSTFQWPPQYEPAERKFVKMATTWVQVDKGIIYVAHAHNTYAASSHGYNAFISALDISKGLLLWRSQPLVSNAGNFVIRDGAIIAGYGFTAEKDFLYVLNQADGRVLQKVPLASGPEYLVEKDNKLYVRTYNMDYIFSLTN